MSEILGLPVILMGALNGALVSLMLLFRRNFTAATLMLWFFIVILLLRLMVYALGAENIYDPHSWLYVPPLEVSFAYGPCLFLFVTYQTQRGFVLRDLRHFIPLVLQLGYYLALLFLPNGTLNQWVTEVHTPWLNNIEVLLVGCSLTAYLWLSWRNFRGYQSWLIHRFSDADKYRLDWPVMVIVLLGMFAFVWSTFSAMQFGVAPSYEGHFGLFALQSIMLSFLALETWRSSGVRFPLQLEYPEIPPPVNSDTAQLRQVYDHCLSQLARHEWWKESQLTLAQLAQRLGTNTTTLSNAINSVGQENFNQLINAIRVRHVCTMLKAVDHQKSLLQLGLDAGFNSKNSFNRNFKKFTGVTPGEYRRRTDTIDNQLASTK